MWTSWACSDTYMRISWNLRFVHPVNSHSWQCVASADCAFAFPDSEVGVAAPDMQTSVLNKLKQQMQLLTFFFKIMPELWHRHGMHMLRPKRKSVEAERDDVVYWYLIQ